MALQNSAWLLFQTIMAAKEPSDDGLSPQRRLFDYVNGTLGSIERNHFDYKTKANSQAPGLEADDKRNVARAVSGFANTEGGVLIWGIEDRTLKPRPIADAERFAQALVDFAKLATAPTVVGLDAGVLPADEPGYGFVALYIPESELPPHRVVVSCKDGNANDAGGTIKDLKIKDHYFFRTADSFIVASHIHLEFLFKRRPAPHLEITRRLDTWGHSGEYLNVVVFVGIRNSGRGDARGPFMAALVHKPYKVDEYGIDGNNNFGLPRNKASSGEDSEVLFGLSSDPIIPSGVSRDVFTVRIKVRRHTPLDFYFDALVIDLRVAAEGYPVEQRQVSISGFELLKFAADKEDLLT